MRRVWLADDLRGIQHYWDRVRCMGNIARLYEGEEMSAFDSAMLMIDDLARKNIELEQKVWELQVSHWHVGMWLNPREHCDFDECDLCTHHISSWHFVNKTINEA